VVLTNAEDIQTDLIGVLDALEQLAHAVHRPHFQACLVEACGETIDSYLSA